MVAALLPRNANANSLLTAAGILYEVSAIVSTSQVSPAKYFEGLNLLE